MNVFAKIVIALEVLRRSYYHTSRRDVMDCLSCLSTQQALIIVCRAVDFPLNVSRGNGLLLNGTYHCIIDSVTLFNEEDLSHRKYKQTTGF